MHEKKKKCKCFWKFLKLCFISQGKAGDLASIDDCNDGAGLPLFTFVDENIFKKETFLGRKSANMYDFVRFKV